MQYLSKFHCGFFRLRNDYRRRLPEHITSRKGIVTVRFQYFASDSVGVGTKRRPKTQKRRPPQNRLEITLKWFERDYRPTQKQETIRFAVLNEFDQGLRFVHNPTKCTKRRPPQNCLEITSNWFERDCGPKQKRETTRFAFINKFDQGLRFVHNPTKSTKRRPVVLKSLQNGSNVIVNRSRNKKQHDVRLLQHAGRYKIHTFKLLSNILLTKQLLTLKSLKNIDIAVSFLCLTL